MGVRMGRGGCEEWGELGGRVERWVGGWGELGGRMGRDGCEEWGEMGGRVGRDGCGRAASSEQLRQGGVKQSGGISAWRYSIVEV